ncbi:MAG: hypothetical protein HN509_11385 [Halobacteriovoraceae bacterium]|jgi:hypothetical protein|nr:hypothetical protein [Halobacteriovoraceae bacterium]MBT5093145.1 hypothetical protein [Halobacteriovoraceae bacterium]
MNATALLTSALLCLSITTVMASTEGKETQISEMYRGTRLIFAKRVGLSEGQKGLRLADGRCRLKFGKQSRGLSHIEKGTELTVSSVSHKEAHQISHPVIAGSKINVGPSITVKFSGVKAELGCSGHNVTELETAVLEESGLLQVVFPMESKPFVF